MRLGLKRNTVQLTDHNPEWEQAAAQAIEHLWEIFGSSAKDIQHVGSTAIKHIKAKPVIDIAVAVDNFAEKAEILTEKLESNGLRFCNLLDERLTFSIDINPTPNPDDRITTHYIHIVNANGTAWHDFLNFRDYLNAHPSVAKAYEALKIKLASDNPFDVGRAQYLAGKQAFITQTLQDAKIFMKRGM